MKRLSMLLFGYYKNDSRMHRTVSALKEYYDITLFSKEKQYKGLKHINLHDRYSEKDIYEFAPNAILPVTFLMKLKYYFSTEIIKYRSIISHPAEIIYCNDFNTLIAGYFASRKLRAKLIYDTHELWTERVGAKLTQFNKVKRIFEYFIEALIIRRCDLVITVSDGIADELVRRFRIGRPVVVRNLDEIKPLPTINMRMGIRRELGIPEDCILIVYQGLLTHERGIIELLAAISNLPGKFHLLLMGPEPDSSIIDSIKSNDRVHYPGFISLSDLHNFTASCDIGIHPIKKSNLNHIITCPNKFSQYMNAGLVPVMSNIQEAQFIHYELGCGLLFDETTPEAIIQTILKIHNSNLQDMKTAARKAFIDNYNWDIEKIGLLRNMRSIA